MPQAKVQLATGVDLLQLYEDVPTAECEAVDEHVLDSPQNVARLVPLREEGGHIALDVINAYATQCLQCEKAVMLQFGHQVLQVDDLHLLSLARTGSTASRRIISRSPKADVVTPVVCTVNETSSTLGSEASIWKYGL
jgi:hypothetical protein